MTLRDHRDMIMASTGLIKQGEGASKSNCGFQKSFLKEDFDSSLEGE